MSLPQDGKTKVVLWNADAVQATEVILQVIRESAQTPLVRQLASDLKNICVTTEQCLQALITFAYKSVYFEPDPPTIQRIKTPQRTLATGRGNCVDYTVLIASVLHALGWAVTIRIIELIPGEGFTHIYPMVDGIAIDCVPFQSQEGEEHLTRQLSTKVHIGEEVPFINKKDFQL